ncbi:MAG: malto-oligosyltrehalose trehalohydrolase [Deltaproteobacteria bacterium]|nr:malto-oligosyltrehalose trehalohydrolase [Deltaproteobacteria bacterium]
MTAATAGTEPLGATPGPEGECSFLVWAPLRRRVDLVLPDGGGPRVVPMQRGVDGYFRARVADAPPGTRYLYRLDGELERPDPASRAQPDGVHGPSAVAAHAPLSPDRQWRGRPLREYVIYELHVGTFTAAGTLDAAAEHLPALAGLGITAIELMPVCQFPGARGWGYDGVYPYAVHTDYGGREALARFVQACHRHGLAVVLDVVYNHLGPEGNYLAAFGPYFTDRYRTAWGDALNFDGPGSDEVRRYFVDNAVEWVEALGVDALRLDAVHAIVDPTARPFLAELSEAVHAAAGRSGREVLVIAESDANDRRLLVGTREGGLGMDAVWADDLHHALHAWLTGERDGYYLDFGPVERLAAAFERGWTFIGQRSEYRDRRHGSDPSGLAAERFVVCAQNHDQVGNRARGERLTALVDPPRVGVALAAVLLSPFTPLVFMGDEHGEERPFPYFISHQDPDLVEAVRRGRAEEFAAFARDGELPDPASAATFASARLDRERPGAEARRALFGALLALRAEAVVPLGPDPRREAIRLGADALLLILRGPDAAMALLLYTGDGGYLSVTLPAGRWRLALSTREPRFGDPPQALPTSLAGGTVHPLTLAGPVAAVWRTSSTDSEVPSP